MAQDHAHQKGRHPKSGKWHSQRIHQIAAILSKMGDMDPGHGSSEDPNDFRSCENLIEAYFMQVRACKFLQ